MTTRVTSSDIIDRLLAALSRTRGEHSSVTITRGMKGAYGFEVTVRTGEETGIDTIDHARMEAAAQVRALEVAFPYVPDESTPPKRTVVHVNAKSRA